MEILNVCYFSKTTRTTHTFSKITSNAREHKYFYKYALLTGKKTLSYKFLTLKEIIEKNFFKDIIYK